MHNFKNIEKQMALSSRRTNEHYANAYKSVMTVFRFLDDADLTCHCKILNALYNVNKRNCTLIGISQNMNISDNALRRYREKYTKCFSFFLNLQRENPIAL